MSFLETPRFPDRVAFGFAGGPRYSTSMVVSFSGKEKRNVNWSQARGRWQATALGKRQEPTDELIAFFRVVKGMGHGFRFKDWTDYSASSGEGVLTMLTLNTTWQMYRRYTRGALTEDRLIQKPRDSHIQVQGGGSYSIAYTTGIITRNSGPNPTGWTGEFDIPARFDSDDLQIEIIERNPTHGFIYRWGNLSITEIRV